MATRTTESTNTLETFRVNFKDLVTDIGNELYQQQEINLIQLQLQL